MLIDTHCHLTFDDLAPQVESVLARARAAGVRRCITVATTVPEAAALPSLLQAHPEVSLIAGIHPHEAAKTSDEDLAALRRLHERPDEVGIPPGRLVAVGETGLDFHYDFATPDQQERVFRTQLDLAVDVNRPVVIHARQAEAQVCDILAEYPRLAGRVVFHCYSGDVDTARRILDLGQYLSFTGVVTFKNAETVRAAARFVPLERVMVETDAPFLAPEPKRKVFPNEPALVVHTARFLAQQRGESYETFAAATTDNARRFFELPGEGG